MRRTKGFTLLEVLVALAIFALVAASVLSAGARSLQVAAQLETRTLAMWLADNQLSEWQLAPTPLALGSATGESEFAGRRWQWQREVIATSEPQMQRVSLWLAPWQSGGVAVRERSVVNLQGFIEVAP
ncbi:general secretion pathway protein I [Pseudomonas cuatrocienegasensis]|uniref:Type II secretion system protein I n=1 Tax=Pseudomonas cuatrocienegasensis TaxID=543360 RepID=A0ABY1BQM1_9PSED|nr:MULTISPECIES: type II secretion system minor pseudopilin GspI [Pseudomonas]OEC32994.1 type II secretion system protein GspI [Pseudomonas sp. 21C1]SER39494.1 general secretion pathway protein I [Pseudomonas cuatrocienegasensis]